MSEGSAPTVWLELIGKKRAKGQRSYAAVVDGRTVAKVTRTQGDPDFWGDQLWRCETCGVTARDEEEMLEHFSVYPYIPRSLREHQG
jgi:hypothetical protein